MIVEITEIQDGFMVDDKYFDDFFRAVNYAKNKINESEEQGFIEFPMPDNLFYSQ